MSSPTSTNPLAVARLASRVLRGATLLCIGGILGCSQAPQSTPPRPVLSPQATLGRRIFFDPAFSASGKISCASCHDPHFAYAPPNGLAVQFAGPNLTTSGLRAVPSLRYTLARTPIWSHPRPANFADRIRDTDSGPRGGLGWDGRFNTLHDQAAFPLTNSAEMASTPESIFRTLSTPTYAQDLKGAFGPIALDSPETAFAAMRQALERFQLEDSSFHPYTSRYDHYLDGSGTLTPQELRGLALFNDPNRGNCATCHLSAKGADGSHPIFTDFQFEALGVPRNPTIPANNNPAFYDQGLCGPPRTDATTQDPANCGLFKTPTLRNVASRQVFFHNGRFQSLREALEFYVQRDTNPTRWYHSTARLPYDDLPPHLRANIDRVTLPLGRDPGQLPLWSATDIDDVLAFLRTLNDADAPIRQ